MEHKQSDENNLSWREAIIESLKAYGKPMSSADIVTAIRQRGLRKVTGNTPEATVGAQIYTSMKRDGEGSPFIQPSPNQFAFRPPSESASGVSQSDADIIPTGGLKPASEITKQRIPLSYNDPLAAVFLRSLAWEIHEAGRKPLVKELVTNQVQTAREDLGLKPNTGGAPHEFIQSLRKLNPPLISCDPTEPLEVGWQEKEKAWRLYSLPSHRLVRMLSYNPIDIPCPALKTKKPKLFQCCLKLRSPASPTLLVTVGVGRPNPHELSAPRGVYFLREQNSLYIGQSDEFEIRWTGHSKTKSVKWWAFIAPRDQQETFSSDSLNAAEALLISFWNEVCDLSNRQRGKDKKPGLGFLQPAILFVEAASSAFLWLIREKKLNFSDWSIPFKKRCSARGWPDCYLKNPVKGKGG